MPQLTMWVVLIEILSSPVSGQVVGVFELVLRQQVELVDRGVGTRIARARAGERRRAVPAPRLVATRAQRAGRAVPAAVTPGVALRALAEVAAVRVLDDQ